MSNKSIITKKNKPEPFNQTLASITSEIAKKNINIEDSAVAQYVKSQADYLISQGKDLSEYVLVRDNGNYEFENGKLAGKVRYGLLRSQRLKMWGIVMSKRLIITLSIEKFLDACKIAFVGFAEQYKWNYHVTLSKGTTFSRKTIKKTKGIYDD
jgi:hypothetical protein